MKHEYKELKIWHKACALNKDIYETTNTFPNDERFSLTNQLRRASVSIASNIAEGCGYDSDPMLVKYLYIATGSLCEVETQVYLANDIGYIDQVKLTFLHQKTDELKRMIVKFINRLKR